MAEPVVSNAGPLMTLAKLNLLHLLKQLYGRVLFTEEVYREVIAEGMRWGYADAQLRSYFAEIEQRTDIWISPALCRRLLQETIGAVDETDRA